MAAQEKPALGVPRATDLVKGLIQEGTKTHSVYDGSSRLTDFYVAAVDAEDGDPCLRTRYTYSGATNLVENSKDELATWDSTWDIV